MTETTLMSLKDNIIRLITNEDGQHNTIPQLHEAKSTALDSFSKNGFPSIKNEEYKYTHLLTITGEDFSIANVTHNDNSHWVLEANEALTAHLSSIHEDLKGESKGAYRIVLYNGGYIKELSILPQSEHFSLSTISHGHMQALGTLSSASKDTFAQLNNALASDVLHLHVSKGHEVDKPFHIIHLSSPQVSTWINDRILITLEASSKLEIIETYAHNSAHTLFNNIVTETFIDANAQLDHYDIHKNSVHTRTIKNNFTEIQKDGRYNHYNINLPGIKLCRNNSEIFVKGSNVNSELFGLTIANDTQLIDNHTAIHHAVPHTESHQLYKGIVLDNAQLVFNGKIFVYEDAQKTNAFQQSNNLLLSPNATVNAKPQLEIFADDVKCSHGSTIGQLDQNAIFYLKSRGIGEESAKKMMIGAFAYDVTDKISNTTVKHYIEKQIASVLD